MFASFHCCYPLRKLGGLERAGSVLACSGRPPSRHAPPLRAAVAGRARAPGGRARLRGPVSLPVVPFHRGVLFVASVVAKNQLPRGLIAYCARLSADRFRLVESGAPLKRWVRCWSGSLSPV